jgi:hypothetical protein
MIYSDQDIYSQIQAMCTWPGCFWCHTPHCHHTGSSCTRSPKWSLGSTGSTLGRVAFLGVYSVVTPGSGCVPSRVMEAARQSDSLASTLPSQVYEVVLEG